MFEVTHNDPTSNARVGRVTTPHGTFDTPAFMPVGTQAAIKGLLPQQVQAVGAQVILANTYHLMLRPGSPRVSRMGGLHPWMRWPGPILTDSGGYQVFSLADIARITDDGVVFRSHLDGAAVELTPQRSMQVQNELGADIVMALDDCPPAPGVADVPRGAVTVPDGGEVHPPARHRIADPRQYAQRVVAACQRTVRWLDACVSAHGRRSDQALFGIVQGGTDLELRTWCAERVIQHDLPGFAIGGVAVGEGHALIEQVVSHTAPLLPPDRPRYLMGVGYERDILAAVKSGVDMFDCVLPTRNGRNGNAFTSDGQIRLRNAKYADDPAVIADDCDCPACAAGFGRSYLRHLLMAGEMLGPILISAHNLRHFQRLLLDIRRSIEHNDLAGVAGRWPAASPGD